jgi:hypothetical protein
MRFKVAFSDLKQIKHQQQGGAAALCFLGFIPVKLLLWFRLCL